MTTLCERKACRAPLDSPRWWNTSTRAYYCHKCMLAITRWAENAGIFEDHRPEDKKPCPDCLGLGYQEVSFDPYMRYPCICQDEVISPNEQVNTVYPFPKL